MKQLPPNLPRDSELTGDSAYTGYHPEEMMQDGGIRLLAARKAGSKHPNDPCVEYLTASQRKRVETVFSDIAKLMPKAIHAVTADGFLIKIIAFIWGWCLIIIGIFIIFPLKIPCPVTQFKQEKC